MFTAFSSFARRATSTFMFARLFAAEFIALLVVVVLPSTFPSEVNLHAIKRNQIEFRPPRCHRCDSSSLFASLIQFESSPAQRRVSHQNSSVRIRQVLVCSLAHRLLCVYGPRHIIIRSAPREKQGESGRNQFGPCTSRRLLGLRNDYWQRTPSCGMFY